MRSEPNIHGLTAAEVAERVSSGDTNHTTRQTSRSIRTILRANLLTLFNGLVGGAFLVLLILGQFKDALFGLAVIANALIGIVQEFRAKRTLDNLTLINQPRSRVMRDGVETEVAVRNVVLGDVLVLKSGDQLPTDCVMVDGAELEVDESMLTGESEPVAKPVGATMLAGSSVVAGHGFARVTVVGDQTYAGKLTTEVRGFSVVKSELRVALNKLIKWISWALIPLSLVAINGQMLAKGGWGKAIVSGDWLVALVGSIASIIAMVPQGLVLMTSLAFAIAAVKLARRNVLVQELPAVEVLARVDVICFDKTGTLTEGSIEFDSASPFEHRAQMPWQKVLAHFAASPDANATAQSLAEEFTDGLANNVTTSVGFSSATKTSSHTFAIGASGEYETWTLGAAEFVLDSEDPAHQKALEAATALSMKANRALVLAVTAADGRLQPAVLLSFSEKLRTDAAQTISYFDAQGVAVRIISGDSPQTVKALAERAGVKLTGEAFDARSLPEGLDEIAEILERNQILGRVTPEQKRNIVLAMQGRGRVVAMIGDGVNDMLALKKADLGIAMSGATAATKSVSNIVLLDNKFDSLPSVVGEGRRVIANIERVSNLFLTKTAWSMTLAIVFGLAMMSFPFLPRQLSAIDSFAIGIPAFFLALLPNPKRYEPGFLARTLRFCVPSGVAVGFGVALLNVIHRDEPLAHLQTATSVILAITGLWVLTILSLPLDRWRVAILATMYLGVVGIFLVPVSNDFFAFTSLSAPLAFSTAALTALCCALTSIIARLAANQHTQKS